MFGYVIANKDIMTEEQEARYRACYCGLCHALHKRHGSLSRLTLTYDMTFLVLLLNSMYEVLDLEGDLASGRYNPVAAFAEGKTEDDLRYTLTMLIGECAAVFERLPVVRDADIMRNILYSGVWLRYNAEMARRHGEEGGKPVES